MTAVTLAPPAVLPARDVQALPWVRPDGAPGARVRTLWESPRSRVLVVLLGPGAGFPLHVHPEAEHHAYVLEGRCTVGERLLGAGSYAHAAAGEPHDVRGEHPSGATLLYVVERS